jgi:hypothetical protein
MSLRVGPRTSTEKVGLDGMSRVNSSAYCTILHSTFITITVSLQTLTVFFSFFLSVLIDDRKDLQDDWEAAGGIFILHTDTVSSLQQLREKGILKPHVELDAKVEKSNDKEADALATTTGEADEGETSKVASKETQVIDTNAKIPNEDELNTVTTTNGTDEETSKVSVKETQGISEPQSDNKVESSKEL